VTGQGDEDAARDAVALLRQRAHRRNLERADRVAELLSSRGTVLDPVARERAMQLCHAMAGSAGTFGDQDLTDAARSLEDALRDGRPDDVPAALDRLRAAARPESSP
jgi:HPt (histidine-containing phosphotransfer) domain-containing protein